MNLMNAALTIILPYVCRHAQKYIESNKIRQYYFNEGTIVRNLLAYCTTIDCHKAVRAGNFMNEDSSLEIPPKMMLKDNFSGLNIEAIHMIKGNNYDIKP